MKGLIIGALVALVPVAAQACPTAFVVPQAVVVQQGHCAQSHVQSQCVQQQAVQVQQQAVAVQSFAVPSVAVLSVPVQAVSHCASFAQSAFVSNHCAQSAVIVKVKQQRQGVLNRFRARRSGHGC